MRVSLASPGQLRGRLKPHRLEVCPASGIVRHQDGVLVTEQDARMLEDASDRWVQLPGDLGLCAPNRPEQSRDLHGSAQTSHITIAGKRRAANGKGVRAILHAAFNVAVIVYAIENRLPHPGFLVLDTPLLTYRTDNIPARRADR